MLTLMASLNSAGWVFACFLGIARVLNNKQNFADIAGLYALMLTGVFAFGLLVTSFLGSSGPHAGLAQSGQVSARHLRRAGWWAGKRTPHLTRWDEPTWACAFGGTPLASYNGHLTAETDQQSPHR
jgi:hypothetical protein